MKEERERGGEGRKETEGTRIKEGEGGDGEGPLRGNTIQYNT